MIDIIIKLTTLAAGLPGNKIRLQGETLEIKTIAISNDNEQKIPHLFLELNLADSEKTHVDYCDCDTCQTALAIKDCGPERVFRLISDGRHKKLLLDSCAACEGGFAVKIRNTATRRCDVGEGKTIVIATARAVTKALHV